MPVIDAHQHFWDLNRVDYFWMSPELKTLYRNYLPGDLKSQLDAADVDQTIFVQASHTLEENRFALELANDHDWIAGVVGWVDLTAKDVDDQLDEFAGHPKFVGIRHITHDEPDDDWIIREDVMRGLHAVQSRGLTFDLLFRPQHLRHIPALAQAFPELSMVIDHIAKPKIKSGDISGTIEPWLTGMKTAAMFENVFCKLSGMITEADHNAWSPADFKPYVEQVFEIFGFDRLMFGSDWPVCRLAGEYVQVVDALTQCLGTLTESERSKVWGVTASRFYGL